MFSMLGATEEKPKEQELPAIEAEPASDAALIKAEEAQPAAAVPAMVVTSQPAVAPTAGGDPNWDPEAMKCGCCGMTRCCKWPVGEPFACCTKASTWVTMLWGFLVCIILLIPIVPCGEGTDEETGEKYKCIVSIGYVGWAMVYWGARITEFGGVLLPMGLAIFILGIFGGLNPFFCMMCPACCCSSEGGLKCCSKFAGMNAVCTFLAICMFLGGWGQIKAILDKYTDDTETHGTVDMVATVFCLFSLVTIIFISVATRMMCKAAVWPSMKPKSTAICC